MPPHLQILLLALVLAAAAYDLKIRKIPNWLSLSGVVLGVGLNTLRSGVAGLQFALLGSALALLIYFPLFLLRGMGAGDVKLMAAVGALAGPRCWLLIFLATALLGGLASLVLVVHKKRVHATLSNLSTIVFELLRARSPSQKDPALDFRHQQAIGLPHGVLIAIGSVVFLFSPWFA